MGDAREIAGHEPEEIRWNSAIETLTLERLMGIGGLPAGSFVRHTRGGAERLLPRASVNGGNATTRGAPGQLSPTPAREGAFCLGSREICNLSPLLQRKSC